MEDTMAHELLAAWANDDFQTVERLLEDEHVQVDVDYQGYFKEVVDDQLLKSYDTLLLRAVWAGQRRVVELLLARGADVNLENKRLVTPLHAAMDPGGDIDFDIDLQLVQLLVMDGADVCAFDEEKRKSPLHLAVQVDNVEILRYLLDNDPSGKGINQVDKEDRTPLDLALQEGRRNCVLELVKRGATSSGGKSPLHAAIAKGKGRVDFVKQVIRHSPRAVDVDERDENGWTPLHHAVAKRYDAVVALLLSKNVDPNWSAKDTFTPLHRAVFTSWGVTPGTDILNWTPSPHPGTLQALLACSEIDVNAVTKNGTSALHFAVQRAQLGDEYVRLLLKRGAKVDSLNELRETPLFDAVRPRLPDEEADPIPCMQRLINAGADVNVSNENGETALTIAIQEEKEEAVELLLASGADHSLSRLHALAVMVRTARYSKDCFVAIARSLCFRGAKWDESCDAQITDEHGRKWCSGLRACVKHWANQVERKETVLADIPIQVIQRGAESVEAYIMRVARNRGETLLQRCKICVVGPTEWGKTTLVKALTTEKKASVDPGADGRTVGIDLRSWNFTSSGTRYEVTFWDMGGQDVYHGAHSLFYSPRSLYVLCIDLEKYRDALTAFAENALAMDKFMRDNIFRWVRAITARHKDATFVAVGTKRDRVEEKAVTAIWEDFMDRWNKWTGKFAVSVKLEEKKIVVSNYRKKSVEKAVKVMKSVVKASPTSVGLSVDHTHVLRWINAKRSEAQGLSDDEERISRVMWDSERLQNELLKECSDVGKSDDILELLHDLGDVYWHESDLGDTIFIDPSLLLEFVKEIITHNCTKDADEESKKHLKEGRICHDTLEKFPHWSCLDDELTCDLKCLLQQLRLAYPYKHENMEWDSDLIVPAYWKRLDQKPTKGPLRDRSIIAKRGIATDFSYHLVYKVPPELSDVVFEQFAVQQQKFRERNIWPNTIEDIFKLCVATITLEHGNPMEEDQKRNSEENAKSMKTTRRKVQQLQDTIDVEVGGPDAEEASEYVLVIFDAMEKVIGDFKGVGVSRFLKDPKGDKTHKWEDVRQDMQDPEFFSNSWAPPNLKEFFSDPDRRSVLRCEKIAREMCTHSRQVLTSHDKLIRIVSETNDNSWELLAKNSVLENLVRTPDWQRRYPKRWKLTYDENMRKAKLEILSESNECFHDPILFDVSEFLAKHSKLMQGCAWLMTVSKKVVAFGFLEDVVDNLVSDFKAKIDRSEKINGMVSLLDLSQGGATLAGETVSEPIAAWFLHELLTLHDPLFQAEKLSLISKLQPKANELGIMEWVPLSDAQNATSCGVSGTSSASASSHDQSEDRDELQQPEDEDDPSGDTSSPQKESKPLRGQLRIISINGLSPVDEREVFCKWILQETSDPPKIICSGTTPRHLDKSQAPSWTDGIPLDNLVSFEQLAECNLHVEVKRPRRYLRTVKPLYTGSEFLRTSVGNAKDDGKPIPVTFELRKINGKRDQVKVSVACELVFN